MGVVTAHLAAGVLGLQQLVACVLLRRLYLGKARHDRVAAALFAARAAAASGLTLLAWLGGSAAYAVAGCAILLLWATFETLEVVSQRHFGVPFLRALRDLPIKAADRSAMRNAAAYVMQYVPGILLLYLAASAGISLSVIRELEHGSTAPLAFLALALAAVLVRYGMAPPAPATLAGVTETLFLKLASMTPSRRLYRADRSAAAAPGRASAAAAGSIVLFIDESVGADVTASGDAGLRLADRLAARSGRAADWVAFPAAVTSSSCTDISLPVILTGSGAHESIEKLHAMPTVFDLAKCRGLKTAFFTSSSLAWANFAAFLSLPALDLLYSAETEKLPLVNDITADDHIVASKAADLIRSADGPLCLVIYLNALHVPFQNDSQAAIPPSLKRRKDRAAYVLEASHAVVLDALRDTGRYDDALILSVGDHGEIVGNDGDDESIRMSRLSHLTETVLRPMFILKPPALLPPPVRSRLDANRSAAVSTIDIAPTIAEALGVELAPGLSYAGHSLFGDIPADRTLYTLNTNEWRSWPRTAVALRRGRSTVVVDYQTMEHLCTDPNGRPFPPDDPAKDALLSAALEIPLVQKAISRVFRDKLQLPYDASQSAATDLLGVLQGGAAQGAPVIWHFDGPGGGLLTTAAAAPDAPAPSELIVPADAEGVVLYGPYVPLEAGHYRATYRFAPDFVCGRLLLEVMLDSTRLAGDRAFETVGDGAEASIDFRVEGQQAAVEVRLHNLGGSHGVCRGLTIALISETA